MLTLVDHAAPSRLREAYLRLRARDPATDLIVDVQRLAELPSGITVILAMTPSITPDALDWLNLNRPLVADRRLNIVLWCEGDAAAVLARGAPDFFDWISARVDCPPAPAAFAVADVKAAIRARAPGIAWTGPGLEDTLAAVRPGRPIHRVAVASYQSMIDALTSRERGWLVLEGIDTEFHLRRLRWAMAETGRRVIVFRRAIDHTLPDWWTVHAEHARIADATSCIVPSGGTGRLAALTGLDPAAVTITVVLLQQGIGTAHLEHRLAAAADPYRALHDTERSLDGCTASMPAPGPPPPAPAGCYIIESEAARLDRDDDVVVSTLHEQPMGTRPWVEIGEAALEGGDFEAASRWLTRGLQLLPDDASPALVAVVRAHRGRARYRAGDLAAARDDLEHAYASAWSSQVPALIAQSAADLGQLLLDQGDVQQASRILESALATSMTLSDHGSVATVLDMLARARIAQHDFAGARQYLERALSIKQRIVPFEDHPSIAVSFNALGGLLAIQGDPEGARRHLERSLEISERLGRAEHPMTMATLEMLAEVYRGVGDLSQARATVDRVRALQRIILGADHPSVAQTLVTLAGLLAASGNADEAQATLNEALAIQHKALGDDGQLAGATTRRELAKVLVAKGDLTGAIENLQQALATLRRIFERDDHPDVAATLRELDRLQALQRDVQRVD
ncbi:MAG TPA: tetratricopeptide repeat protein [Kofleriaceae bacterium]|nr:tetratricopeptide repeat protein [Kofleriaceae bacterium]